MLNAVTTTSLVMILVACANAFAFLLTICRVPEQLAGLLLLVSDNPLVILLVLNLILLALGMIMDMAALILITTPILLPVAVGLGMNPVQFGIMLMMNLGLGLCIPLWAPACSLVARSAVSVLKRPYTPSCHSILQFWPHFCL